MRRVCLQKNEVCPLHSCFMFNHLLLSPPHTPISSPLFSFPPLLLFLLPSTSLLSTPYSSLPLTFSLLSSPRFSSLISSLPLSSPPLFSLPFLFLLSSLLYLYIGPFFILLNLLNPKAFHIILGLFFSGFKICKYILSETFVY